MLLVACFTFFSTTCNTIRVCYKLTDTISPLDYGLKEAKTGEERYMVLRRTHEEAQRLGVGVSYAGIKEIQLKIPAGAKPLPLTNYTDFAGVTIKVENIEKGFFLFSVLSSVTQLEVKGMEIDSRDYSNNRDLRKGNKLLVVTDNTPWVENRKGYDYGAIRKDIVMVANGKGSNGPVQSYCSIESNPECYYCEVNPSEKKIIKNITFERLATSTEKTYLVKIENQNNVELSNITIKTPQGSGLYGDRAIFVANCMNVTLSDITINDTYSLPNKYGYGVSLNNIYNLHVDNMYARADWGVFGNNNVHKATLKKCDINRFDIHCYGKDIIFEDCNFVNLYNQFSSVYGLISFKNCVFTGFTPVLIGHSYNAYTAYDLYFESCTFNLDKLHNRIVDFSGFAKEENSRHELKEKCLPNVTMVDCQVNAEGGLKKWYIYNTKAIKGYKGEMSHLSKVIIEGLSVNNQTIKMEVFSDDVKTVNIIQKQISFKEQ